MGLSRQEYQSGLPFPPPVYHPYPGVKPAFPASPALQADSLWLSHQGTFFMTVVLVTVSPTIPTFVGK